MKSKTRILVVDDNHSIVRIIEQVLQNQGYQVLTAFDGDEGLKKAQQEKPDLIILDIVMPGMDGYAVCRHLQRERATASIPVIMLTVKGQVEELNTLEDKKALVIRVQERMAGYDAGAVEFLSKPITAKQLIERVKRVLWFSRV